VGILVTGWFREYGGLVRGIARTFASEEDDLEDLSQEIWAVVVRRVHDAPAETRIRSWLVSIAIRVCIGHRRKIDRRRRLFREWLGRESPRQDGIPGRSIDHHLRIRKLWRMIDQLPPLQRETLLLRISLWWHSFNAHPTTSRATGGALPAREV
jgi:RNA polymerase sigma factor (sigma-70 family)